MNSSRIIACVFFILAGYAPNFAIPAFPGAEGFGSQTTGGRGGKVVYVTNLNIDGPGSLLDALSMNEPRYVLFKVSGHIQCGHDYDGKLLRIKYGDVTIAGQTSPGGVTAHGILSDNEYATNRDNVMIRHMRFRPETRGLDDCMRLIYCRDAIVDHCSFGHSMDETIQISAITNYTIQNCIVAEKGGEDYTCAGVLIKYTSLEYPLNNVSFHHNILNRLADRTPEIQCDDDESNLGCSDQAEDFNIEVSNNVMWDVNYPIVMINKFVNTGNHVQRDYNANFVGNLFFVRASYPFSMFEPFDEDSNQVYMIDNKIQLYQDFYDYQLMFCCNNFYQDNPNTEVFAGVRRTGRNPFPQILYNHNRTDDDVLLDYMDSNAGAFPRDSMDRRLMKYVAQRSIDPTPLNSYGDNGANDGFLFDFDTLNPPVAPTDADSDGMPDYWETANGLDPNLQDHNGTGLSVQYTGIEGYTNLECYLNKLSDSLVNGVSTVVSAIEAGENENWALANAIEAYPNPFNPAVTISVGAIHSPRLRESEAGESPLHVSVYDLSGRFITDLKMHNGSATWDASAQASGIYIVRAAFGNTCATKRVTVVR